LHPCQPPVRPHSPRPIPGVSPAACAMRRRSRRARGCAIDVVAATPKRRAAPQKGSTPGTHRPSLFCLPAGLPPGPTTDNPFRRLRTGMRVVSAVLEGAERRLTWLDECTGEGRRCSMTSIEIRGARTHNLQGHRRRRSEAPARRLYGRERQRHVVARLRHNSAPRRGDGSSRRLGTHARRRLPQLTRPPVDAIRNISPCIVIDQKRLGASSRSTVGTVTGLALDDDARFYVPTERPASGDPALPALPPPDQGRGAM